MFTIVGGKTEFTQWSQGEKVTHEKLVAGDKVKFTNRSGRVINMTADANGEVSVPNVFLKEHADILVNIVGKPETRHKLDVIGAEKPDGWCDIDNSIVYEFDGKRAELIYSGEVKCSPTTIEHPWGDGEITGNICEFPTLPIDKACDLFIVWDGVTYPGYADNSGGELYIDTGNDYHFVDGDLLLEEYAPIAILTGETGKSYLFVDDSKSHTLSIYKAPRDMRSVCERKAFDLCIFLMTRTGGNTVESLVDIDYPSFMELAEIIRSRKYMLQDSFGNPINSVCHISEEEEYSLVFSYELVTLQSGESRFNEYQITIDADKKTKSVNVRKNMKITYKFAVTYEETDRLNQ